MAIAKLRRKSWHFTPETLEGRQLLAATADIVFLIDESASQAATHDGDAVRPWVSLIVQQLEQKLVDRGIGSEENLPNRYGIVAFGAGNPATTQSARARILNTGGGNPELLPTAEDFDDFFALTPLQGGFENDGDREDAWEALLTALGRGGLGAGYTGDHHFRSEAALHFIIVTDEQRESVSGRYGNLGGVALTQDPEEQDTLLPSRSDLFSGILNALRKENVPTEDDEIDLLSDAVVTVVAPFWFDEAGFGAIVDDDYDETILGVDVHRLDEINLDLNSWPMSGDVEENQPDEYAVFKWQDWSVAQPPEQSRVVVDDNNGDEILIGKLSQSAVDYQDIRDLCRMQTGLSAMRSVGNSMSRRRTQLFWLVHVRTVLRKTQWNDV